MIKSLEVLSAVKVLEQTQDVNGVIKEYLRRNPWLLHDVINDTSGMGIKEKFRHFLVCYGVFHDYVVESLGYHFEQFLEKCGISFTSTSIAGLCIYPTNSDKYIRIEMETGLYYIISLNEENCQLLQFPKDICLDPDVVINSLSDFNQHCWPFAEKVLDILIEHGVFLNK